MTNPGLELTRLRKTGSHSCAVCGKVFTARLTALYCSKQCRMKAAYERRRREKK